MSTGAAYRPGIVARMNDLSPMPAPPDGDRVFELLESTHRYLLTREEDGYAVWDTEGGVDEPVDAFPLTDEGEQDARDLFQSLFAVFIGASVLYVVLWISRRAPS
jgi:hypothetical protein